MFAIENPDRSFFEYVLDHDTIKEAGKKMLKCIVYPAKKIIYFYVITEKFNRVKFKFDTTESKEFKELQEAISYYKGIV